MYLRTRATCVALPSPPASKRRAEGGTIRKSFKTLSDARAWRADTQAALRRGAVRAPTKTTLAEAAEDWLAVAHSGIARTRSGDPYKPSALRSYEEALRTKVLPELGHLRLSAVDRLAIQDLIDRLTAQGRAPSTVRNAVLPLRAVFRCAVARQEVVHNPTLALSLPSVRTRHERVARPGEATEPGVQGGGPDRAVTRGSGGDEGIRGELQALRW